VETSRIGPGRFSRRTVLITASVAGLAVLGLFYWYWSQGPDPAHAGRPARAAVPVSVATASRQDVPVYLTGLGTVQALFTVGIHAQVDGKLKEVFFKEGQRVQKGDVLAKIDPRLYQAALDQAKAHKAQDEATLTAAVKDLSRFQTLAAKNIETQQNLDLQQAKVDQAKASIAADDAAIETAQTNLDYTDIVATNDGRMGVRMVDPGNIVHANDQGAIAILTQTEPITVTFTLPAQTLDDVRDAMARGAVEVAAYDRDNTRLLSTGTLTTIDNLIDPTTASFRLKAIFKNADEKLWPGEFVNARLLVDTRKDVVVIPPLAVQRGPRGLFVSSGVNDGDRVVTDGQYKLQANAPVTITAPSTAATPGNAS
jgi:multidrug efflux system membrane fusion protein